ncbi:hypothetical protein FGO68_gene10049 [Halteria grandinella]|uniref:Uncharacterized protein n=1 Tax=Halteria grandinella TaxID=5974 RepID=A0A8J8SUI2_HALGN|nr:hypothetical protein FGO68_gene10049 [Halteria grandinella]
MPRLQARNSSFSNAHASAAPCLAMQVTLVMPAFAFLMTSKSTKYLKAIQSPLTGMGAQMQRATRGKLSLPTWMKIYRCLKSFRGRGILRPWRRKNNYKSRFRHLSQP